MKLSVVLVAYNMAREIPRTLASLAPDYQRGCAGLDCEDYEVVLVENGSTHPLEPDTIKQLPDYCHYHYIADAPSSPAHAINVGVAASRGDALAIMIDGAHMLTPGVLRYAKAAFAIFDHPVVVTRAFFLGPGDQNDTIFDGYSQAVEDELLAKIDWPQDGYRLFEIGEPAQGYIPRISWFNRMIESNCLVLSRPVFDQIGGADERFDSPGGGFINLDIFREAAGLPQTEVVQLIGEGTFHQLHGGTTTNVGAAERDAKVKQYEAQYRAIRGKDLDAPPKELQFLGHMPTPRSKIHLLNHGREQKPIPEDLKLKILSEP
ncbi:MAG: glycosyltransferase family A protein [Pseudomonadota bacterium]